MCVLGKSKIRVFRRYVYPPAMPFANHILRSESQGYVCGLSSVENQQL